VRHDSDQFLNDDRYFKHDLDMNLHYLAYLEHSSRAAPRGMWFEGISIWVMQLVFMICWLLISLNFGLFLYWSTCYTPCYPHDGQSGSRRSRLARRTKTSDYSFVNWNLIVLPVVLIILFLMPTWSIRRGQHLGAWGRRIAGFENQIVVTLLHYARIMELEPEVLILKRSSGGGYIRPNPSPLRY
jgi:hypothetical protein